MPQSLQAPDGGIPWAHAQARNGECYPVCPARMHRTLPPPRIPSNVLRFYEDWNVCARSACSRIPTVAFRFFSQTGKVAFLRRNGKCALHLVGLRFSSSVKICEIYG